MQAFIASFYRPVRMFLFIFYFILFQGCIRTIRDDQRNVFFTRRDFRATEFLKADTIFFSKPLNPLSYLILKDTLILVTNLSHPDHYLEIYNLKTQEILCTAAKKGRGPGEFLSCNVYYNNNEDRFFVHDVVAKSWGSFHIDSLISFKDSYLPVKYILPDFVKEVAELDPLYFVGYNIWFLDNKKYNNLTDKLIIWQKGIKPFVNEDKKEKFYEVMNVTGAYLLVSPDKDKIGLAYFYNDKIEFYDNKLNLIKVLEGPDNIKPELEETNERKVIFKDGKYYRAFFPFYSTDESFFIIYLGINGLKGDDNFRKPVEIFQISWEGDLIKRYQLDNYIFNLSLDSKQENIYGTHWKKFGETPLLLKYRIKE